MANRKWLLEMIWWMFTAILAVGILLPILSASRSYHFLEVNIVFIVVFITLARYIFLLHLTFLSRLEWLKVVLIFVSPVIIFLLVQEINRFQTFIDEYAWEAVLGNLPTPELNRLADYTHTEFLFFGVGSVIAAAVLPLRMMVSIWRIRKRGRE